MLFQAPCAKQLPATIAHLLSLQPLLGWQTFRLERPLLPLVHNSHVVAKILSRMEVVSTLITNVGKTILVDFINVLFHRVGDGASVVASGAFCSIGTKDVVFFG